LVIDDDVLIQEALCGVLKQCEAILGSVGPRKMRAKSVMLTIVATHSPRWKYNSALPVARLRAPEGRSYHQGFGKWLKNAGFDRLDKGDGEPS
jgi:hypothetical protein